jgi:hemerythrin
MSLLWRDQFSVGNDLIDMDHKHLIEIINKAEINLKTNSRSEFNALLEELSRYSKTHFEREELLAKAVDYPGSGQLHESHTFLVANLEQFKKDVGAEWSEEAIAKFTTFLRDWLIKHVIKEDLPMKPWMIKHSPRFDPRV